MSIETQILDGLISFYRDPENIFVTQGYIPVFVSSLKVYVNIKIYLINILDIK